MHVGAFGLHDQLQQLVNTDLAQLAGTGSFDLSVKTGLSSVSGVASITMIYSDTLALVHWHQTILYTKRACLRGLM